MTPTARTLALMRRNGWTAQVVERWNPHARIRQDLFGFGDVIACRGWITENSIPQPSSITLIQATTQANAAARVAKITTNPDVAPLALRWLESGGRIVVHGWRKLKVKRGGRAVRWEVDARQVERSDIAPTAGDPGKDAQS